MKRKALSYLFAASSAALLTLSLASCGDEDATSDTSLTTSVTVVSESDETTSGIITTTTEEEDSLCTLSSDAIAITGKSGYLAVSNETESLCFTGVLSVPDGSTWKAFSDFACKNELPDNTLSLSLGDNFSYIKVTSRLGTVSEIYQMCIRRKHVYTVSFNTAGGAEMSPLTMEEDSMLSEDCMPSRPGYTFNGWMINGNIVTLPYKITNDVILTASWSGNGYGVTLEGYDDVYVLTIGENYTLPVPESSVKSDKGYTMSYDFLGWSYDGRLMTDENGNSLTSYDIPDRAVFTPLWSEEYSICFGSYPQTLVEGEETEALSSFTFSTETWEDYGYYDHAAVSSYMYYLDVDTDGNGEYDYRGVYFTKYRSYYTKSECRSSTSCTYDNGYRTDTIYWFRYEPISWRILKEEDGKALLVSDMILDAGDYYHTTDPRYIDDVRIWSNNYRHSSIRTFLNERFYTQAFTTLQKDTIETTRITNSAESAGFDESDYECENTEDDVFLLSVEQANDYFEDNADRICKTTDYTKIQGGYSCVWEGFEGNGHWLLRSAYAYSDTCVMFAGNDGKISNTYTYSIEGIRPACWISL